MDNYDEKMEEELERWQKLGVNPGQYTPGEGILGMMFRFETLHKLLLDKDIFTEEESNEVYREVSLSGLQQVRENIIEPAVREAMRAKIKAPAMYIPKNNKKH